MLDKVIKNFSEENWKEFLEQQADSFRPQDELLSEFDTDLLYHATKVGAIELDEVSEVDVVCGYVTDEVNTKKSKKKQYDIAKQYLKAHPSVLAVIFVYYDAAQCFRCSLVTADFTGTKRQFSPFKRYTFFVDSAQPNKTFRQQMLKASFQSLEAIKATFSLDAVTEEFYKEFMPRFEDIAQHVVGPEDANTKQDFALLFVVRMVFLGFVQKKQWLEREDFLQSFWQAYARHFYGEDRFYRDWLQPLFFEALKSPPGRKVKYPSNDFPEEFERILQMAPFLNGELFEKREGFDKVGYYIPDENVKAFINFLFEYNFTIEENHHLDEELELNPEFLGLIFERLVNKDQGAVYTPRPEVDMMCRLSLQRWLERNADVDHDQLYHLFWREGGRSEAYDEYQKSGNFSAAEIREVWNCLDNVTICDPAVGSGAFPVGMMQVMESIYTELQKLPQCPPELKESSSYERKKAIIAQSLYGVEVKEWAVWICQLRLWLSLFIDMPEENRVSYEPLLPNLQFKIRVGDALVQRIGSKMFPVQGHADISSKTKQKVTDLKKAKKKFFYNKGSLSAKSLREKENRLFREIIEDEIKEKQRELKRLNREEWHQQGQQQLSYGESKPHQQVLDFNKEKKESLKADIQELNQQLDSLKETHPLIWSIEFSEIFYSEGGFDLVIGNPPYVRREGIADPFGQFEPTNYKRLLKEAVQIDFPKHFTKKQPIDAKSDLYLYFYIRSLRLLNANGVHCFICSNSWLDAGYGIWFQYFLLKHVPLRNVIDNHARRSFANSDINTVITLMDAPAKQKAKKDWQKQQAKFIAFKKPFDESVITENWQTIAKATETIKSEDFRVYPISLKSLQDTGTEYPDDIKEKQHVGSGNYIGEKWGGKFLRSHDILLEIFKRYRNNIDKLKNFFIGERYLNTGGADGFFIPTFVKEYSNEFYYVFNSNNNDQGKPFEGFIQKEFVKPLIKDFTKFNKKILIDSFDAYCIVIDPNRLTHEISKYIEWGEKQGYNQKSVTRLQKPWYRPTKQMLEGAKTLVQRSYNNSFVIYYNPNKYLSLRYYRFHEHEKANVNLLIAFLNSSLFWLIIETLGNSNQGQGVLDFHMDSLLNINIPVITSLKSKEPFEKIKNRKIHSVFEELGLSYNISLPFEKQDPKPMSDRKALDDVVFDALDLNEEERREVYRAVCRLVWNRINKASSV